MHVRRTHMHTPIHTHIYTHTHRHIHAHTYARTDRHTHTNTHARTYTHAHACTHAHTTTHTHRVENTRHENKMKLFSFTFYTHHAPRPIYIRTVSRPASSQAFPQRRRQACAALSFTINDSGLAQQGVLNSISAHSRLCLVACRKKRERERDRETEKQREREVNDWMSVYIVTLVRTLIMSDKLCFCLQHVRDRLSAEKEEECKDTFFTSLANSLSPLTRKSSNNKSCTYFDTWVWLAHALTHERTYAVFVAAVPFAQP